MKKVLQPVKHRDSYNRAIEKLILDYFRETIFVPLLDMMEDEDVRVNSAETAVSAALKSGKIWYADGEFSGEYNAAIARELREMGATLSRTRGTFVIEASRLPDDIRGAAAMSVDRSRALHQRMQDTLGQMQAHAMAAATGLDVTEAVGKIVNELTTQFNGTIDGLELISVTHEMTEPLAKVLSEQLTENLNLSVKGFANEEIIRLRSMVQQNAFGGARITNLADAIEAQFNVTKSKAAFLADQEIGMLTAKFREFRAREVGSRTYRWSTSHDERVRPDHRLLNDQVFAWDSPPITNRQTGDRNHPGEDFRCRCVALPIIELPE